MGRNSGGICTHSEYVFANVFDINWQLHPHFNEAFCKRELKNTHVGDINVRRRIGRCHPSHISTFPCTLLWTTEPLRNQEKEYDINQIDNSTDTPGDNHVCCLFFIFGYAQLHKRQNWCILVSFLLSACMLMFPLPLLWQINISKKRGPKGVHFNLKSVDCGALASLNPAPGFATTEPFAVN